SGQPARAVEPGGASAVQRGARPGGALPDPRPAGPARGAGAVSESNPQALLPAVIALVERAGQAALPFWRRELAVQHKADESPVTAADLAANRVPVEGLTTLPPEIPVLSEEACAIPLAARAAWRRWWLVDPLDGTKEFIAGSAEFTVNVALVEQGRVLFGVVGVPADGRCYHEIGSASGRERVER